MATAAADNLLVQSPNSSIFARLKLDISFGKLYWEDWQSQPLVFDFLSPDIWGEGGVLL